MADRKKSSAPSHTHKVICPHCKAEISYRNLKRYLESLHPEKDQSGFYLKDSQSDKLLKPTKLTTFFSLKRKEEDAVSDSPRPVKKRNVSGDSAVSLDFTTGDSGDDDSEAEVESKSAATSGEEHLIDSSGPPGHREETTKKEEKEKDEEPNETAEAESRVTVSRLSRFLGKFSNHLVWALKFCYYT